MNRRWVLLLLVFELGLGVARRAPAADDVRAQAPAIADVAAAFERLASAGALVEFARGEATIARGGHLQGIQLQTNPTTGRHVAYLSHDSETVAYLAVVEFPAGLSTGGRLVRVHELPSDGRSPPLRHAGGLQLSGEVLVVGVEDNQAKTRSEIQFWNTANPAAPVPWLHLTIRREGVAKDKTAGAVGLVARRNDYLLAVANWDSRAIDFYLSNGKPLADEQCRFDFHARWADDAADKSLWQPDRQFGAYQAVNLLADSAGNIFLLGFETRAANKDVVDLLAVDLQARPERLLRKVAGKSIILPGDNHFRYSGGLWVDEGRLGILSSPQDFGSPTRISMTR